MKPKVLYVHGQGGSAAEAAHFAALFPNRDVIGLDYKAATPWEARLEFPAAVDALCGKDAPPVLIANSIGAYFSMHALSGRPIEKAFLISPIADMAQLILARMAEVGVTPEMLREKGAIATPFGESLTWDYFCFAKEHPVTWDAPACILYGENDTLTSREAMTRFADRIGATLTVMPGGEHWFHTPQQLAFLDNWIRSAASFGG